MWTTNLHEFYFGLQFNLMEPQADNNLQSNVEFRNLDTQSPGHQTVISKQGNNKFLLIILLILVAISLSLSFLILRKDVAQPKITGLEVALKTASFLDKTFKLDGSFVSGFSCTKSSGECVSVPLSVEQPHIGQAVYGYYILAEASGNQSFREKADLAMTYILDNCEKDIRFCEWNFFPLAQYYFDTHDEKYLQQGMLPPAEKLLTLSSTTIIEANVGHKLASLYQATGDVRYKDRLIAVAEDELKNWPGDEDKFLHSIQISWSIFLPSYNITKDPKYLNAVEVFFGSFNTSENLHKFGAADSAVRAVDALLSLSLISENGAMYKTQAHTVLQDLLYNIWDTPQNIKVNGDYGFLNNFRETDKAVKSVLFNGWLIKLFVLMKDEVFLVGPVIK